MMLIEDGTIHPRLTFNEARELVAKFKGWTKRTTRINVIRHLQRFRALVDTTLNEWTSDERELAQIELSQVIEQIAGIGSRTSQSPAGSASLQNESPADAQFSPSDESKKHS